MEQVPAPPQPPAQPPQWTGQGRDSNGISKLTIFLFYELNIIEAKCFTCVRYCGGALNCDGANPAKTQSHTIVRSGKIVIKRIYNL